MKVVTTIGMMFLWTCRTYFARIRHVPQEAKSDQALVEQETLELVHVQADEIRVKGRKAAGGT